MFQYLLVLLDCIGEDFIEEVTGHTHTVVVAA